MERLGRYLKILVFASGGATDMESIVKAIEQRTLDARIVGLICDRPDAFAIIRAKNYGIPTSLIELGDKIEEGRKAFDKATIEEVEKYNPDLILLLGWMKILSPEFVEKYGGLKTWNIHPSLLPMFAGGMDRGGSMRKS